jgi:tRNA pseudouridine55 synthase
MNKMILSIDPNLDIVDAVKAGHVLLIDKPLTWSSFQVVSKIRSLFKYRLGVKKLKVGHAGTLDPLASGLLVICIGRKTKEINSFIGQEKVYTGTFILGATRPSFDMETEIEKEFNTQGISEMDIMDTAKSFLGEQLQTPPIFSAKKIDGKRAYEYARKGEEVKMRQNLITVHTFKIEKIEGNVVHFYIAASKGTYIRSIANDFGERLKNGAYLSSLRRVRSGDFDIKDAYSIEEFEEELNNLALK